MPDGLASEREGRGPAAASGAVDQLDRCLDTVERHRLLAAHDAGRLARQLDAATAAVERYGQTLLDRRATPSARADAERELRASVERLSRAVNEALTGRL